MEMARFSMVRKSTAGEEMKKLAIPCFLMIPCVFHASFTEDLEKSFIEASKPKKYKPLVPEEEETIIEKKAPVQELTLEQRLAPYEERFNAALERANAEKEQRDELIYHPKQLAVERQWDAEIARLKAAPHSVQNERLEQIAQIIKDQQLKRLDTLRSIDENDAQMKAYRSIAGPLSFLDPHDSLAQALRKQYPDSEKHTADLSAENEQLEEQIKVLQESAFLLESQYNAVVSFPATLKKWDDTIAQLNALAEGKPSAQGQALIQQAQHIRDELVQRDTLLKAIFVNRIELTKLQKLYPEAFANPLSKTFNAFNMTHPEAVEQIEEIDYELRQLASGDTKLAKSISANQLDFNKTIEKIGYMKIEPSKETSVKQAELAESAPAEGSLKRQESRGAYSKIKRAASEIRRGAKSSSARVRKLFGQGD